MTSLPISPELREQIAAHPGETIRMRDEASGKIYLLVEQSSVHQTDYVRGAPVGRSVERLRELIQEGLEGPHYDEDEADLIIDAFLKDLEEAD